MMIQKTALPAACLFLCFTTVSCGVAPRESSDPQQVAKGYLRAVAKADLEQVLEYVLPANRLAVELNWNPEDLPAYPEKPELRVQIEDDIATVEIVNSEGNQTLQLVYRDDRWWVAN